MSASDSHPQRCEVHRLESHYRLHVLWRSERFSGPAPAHFENGRDAEDQRQSVI